VSLVGGDRNEILNNVVSGAGGFGLTSSDDTDSLMRGNVISGRNSGIHLGAGSVNVDANIVSDAITAAIYLTNSGAFTITGNDLSKSARGLFTYYATASAIAGNVIHDNTTGIEGYGTFGGTSWSAGQPNDIYGNVTGILAYPTATVRFNRIHDNKIGIRADDNSSIHHNVIYRNTSQGILFDGTLGATVTNNTIYKLIRRMCPCATT
jgi:parallel beta-helix repeat protein